MIVALLRSRTARVSWCACGVYMDMGKPPHLDIKRKFGFELISLAEVRTKRVV